MATTIAQKLKFKDGMRALIEGAPEGFDLAIAATETGPYAFQLRFARSRADVVRIAKAVEKSYQRGGLLWIAYPKKSGAIETDLSRDVGWEPLMSLDFLPVSIVSLDADWSALRFRKRSEIKQITRKF